MFTMHESYLLDDVAEVFVVWMPHVDCPLVGDKLGRFATQEEGYGSRDDWKHKFNAIQTAGIHGRSQAN